jgi:hypothetical protein
VSRQSEFSPFRSFRTASIAVVPPEASIDGETLQRFTAACIRPVSARGNELLGTEPQKGQNPLVSQGVLNGAAEWNRTIDLTLTKGMLYRLSYGSNSVMGQTARRRGALYATGLFTPSSDFLTLFFVRRTAQNAFP